MASEPTRLFLCGDVMTGRGIDQILPHPSQAEIYESWVRDARQYVALAEQRNGTIIQPVDYSYIWGDALAVLERFAPAVRIINLETAVTRSDDYWPGKGINYRMHPDNTACIGAAGIDCCSLANNHVLDWGYRGLTETLASLDSQGIEAVGAGENLGQARHMSCINLPSGSRVYVTALGSTSSGIPEDWSATPKRPGVYLVNELYKEWLPDLAARIEAHKRPGDIVVCSVHWGGNWGYAIPATRRRLAQQLIDQAGVDIVHGHSSHHPLGIEVYKGKLILYGCGDFINDYEGISGHEEYRPDLRLMYLVGFDGKLGHLAQLQLVPMRAKRFQLHRAEEQDRLWIRELLDREGAELGTGLSLSGEQDLLLEWG